MKDEKELTPELLRRREQDRRRREAERQDPARYQHHLLQIRRWQQEHPEAMREARRRWQEANKQYTREYARKVYAENPEYRAKKIQAMRQRDKKRLEERPSHPCGYCQTLTKRPRYCSRQCAGKAPKTGKR